MQKNCEGLEQQVSWSVQDTQSQFLGDVCSEARWSAQAQGIRLHLGINSLAPETGPRARNKRNRVLLAAANLPLLLGVNLRALC